MKKLVVKNPELQQRLDRISGWVELLIIVALAALLVGVVVWRASL